MPRPAVDQERPAAAPFHLMAPERFARVQIGRLIKALRLVEAAIEFGELRAAATYLRIAAALDRYHELAAGSPLPGRSTTAASQALPTEPQAPTSLASPDQDDSAAVEEAQNAAEAPEQ